jgi:hypothetical protein
MLNLSGIFNVLLIALRRLLRNCGSGGGGAGIFVNEKTIQTRREKYEMAANPIGSFIKNATAEDAVVSDKITKDEFYQAYKRYCEKNKVAVESNNLKREAKSLKAIPCFFDCTANSLTDSYSESSSSFFQSLTILLTVPSPILLSIAILSLVLPPTHC